MEIFISELVTNTGAKRIRFPNHGGNPGFSLSERAVRPLNEGCHQNALLRHEDMLGGWGEGGEFVKFDYISVLGRKEYFDIRKFYVAGTVHPILTPTILYWEFHFIFYSRSFIRKNDAHEPFNKQIKKC